MSDIDLTSLNVKQSDIIRLTPTLPTINIPKSPSPIASARIRRANKSLSLSVYLILNNLSPASLDKASNVLTYTSSFLYSSLSTTAISNTLSISSLSILEKAILKNTPNIIGKIKVQNINTLLLNNIFILYLKL